MAFFAPSAFIPWICGSDDSMAFLATFVELVVASDLSRSSQRSLLRRTQQVICARFAPTPPQNTPKRDQASGTTTHHLTGERLDRFRDIAREIRGLPFLAFARS